LALGRQGKLVFHASAVELGDIAIAFVGASGAGKSTLAAAFATSGSRFLTDDGLVVDLRDGAPVVLPSHPSIRLWDDSRDALAGEAVPQPTAHFTRKGRFLAGDALVHCDEPRRLARIYFLGDEAQAPALTAVPAVEAAIELVRHSFLIDIGERDLL